MLSASRPPLLPLPLPPFDILLWFSDFWQFLNTLPRSSAFEFARFARFHRVCIRRPLSFSHLQPTFRALRQAISSFTHPLSYSAMPSSIFRDLFRPFHPPDFINFFRPLSTLHQLPRSIFRCSMIFFDLIWFSDPRYVSFRWHLFGKSSARHWERARQ
jgi:hypothetical protein